MSQLINKLPAAFSFSTDNCLDIESIVWPNAPEPTTCFNSVSASASALNKFKKFYIYK